jgi:hypothetical protein
MLPDRLSRLLTGFVDGQLSAQEQKQVVELLRRSAEARALLQHLQADSRLLGGMPLVQLPVEFSEQLQARLPNRRHLKVVEPRRTPERRLSWREAGILAAAATLLLAVGIAFLHTGDKPVGPDRSGVEGASIIPGDKELDPDLLANVAPAPPAISASDKAQSANLIRVGNTQPELLSRMPREEADVVTAPVRDVKPLREIDLKVPLLLAMREIDRDKNRQEITEELALARSWRLDLNCQEGEAATFRLKRALQEQGIRLLVDPDAAGRQTLRRARTTYSILVENVSPQECLAMLSGLRQVDREEQTRDRGRNQFIDVKFGRMTEKDGAHLELLFGIKELKPAVAAPAAPARLTPVEVTYPDRIMTPLERAIALWQGQNPQQMKMAGQGVLRNALLVAEPISDTRKPSNESQLFLNSRQPPRPGMLQIMIVLTPRKG